MGSAKSRICSFKGCKKSKRARPNGWIRSSFCTTHSQKVTVSSFLSKLYSGMNRRVSGKHPHDRGNWKGKSLLPRDIFMTWAKNHPDFLGLYKRYLTYGFDIKLAPSINRIDSNKGYTLDNIEWMTHSQNCSLAGSVRKMNNKEKKMIYKVLGVTK